MKKLHVYESLAFLILTTVLLTGCDAIQGIFSAGVWVGILIVIVVVFIIIRVFAGGKK